jgi:hypothetical protein
VKCTFQEQEEVLLLIHIINISLMDFATTRPLRRVKAFAPNTFVLYKKQQKSSPIKTPDMQIIFLKTIVLQKQITKHFKTWKQ